MTVPLPAPAGSAQRAVLVEAFAAGPLQGNGAAVVLLQDPAPVDWMQALAASFRQSETAFLWRRPDGVWALRWFTPSCEVPLCGHATLAAVLALGHWGLLARGATLSLASRSGSLAVQLQAAPAASASLVLPSGSLEDLTPPAYLAELCGGELLGYWGSLLGYRVALLPPQFPLAALASPAPLLQGQDRQGLVLMQAAGPPTPAWQGRPCDYQLRFFAPGLGIDEDPVTGSAHALVAPWWMRQIDRNSVIGWQCSPRHGGMLCEQDQAGHVRLTGSGHLLWDGLIHAGGAGHDDEAGWRVCQGGAVAG
ncbi:MAG: hypothetical protein RLZZ459_1310 [Cyanobacteriota bacterium]|jgi:predicted PhzF superfamily epimerase YddE/YHI9